MNHPVPRKPSLRRTKTTPPPPPLRLNHYKHVYWITDDGPMATAYRAVVLHDGCAGCLVCEGTTDWFMEFARVARHLLGINLRDCLHWGPLHDSPRPLIAPASNLHVCNRSTLERLRRAYYCLREEDRPSLENIPSNCRRLSQAQRFEVSVAFLSRMVDLWEQGQYIGWPS